ncbi:hypothetical protein PG985_011169 [Apiospora marii]|uniref:uncharacterized protein n=1 Tax=Apiospora marii TaxID=335849 RepID=UPI003130AB62
MLLPSRRCDRRQDGHITGPGVSASLKVAQQIQKMISKELLQHYDMYSLGNATEALMSLTAMRQAVAAKEKAQAEDRRREATAREVAGEALARDEGTRLEPEQQEVRWAILYLGFTATCGDCAFFKLGARNETLESSTMPRYFYGRGVYAGFPGTWLTAEFRMGLVVSTASDAEGELEEDDPSLTRALTTDQRQRKR